MASQQNTKKRKWGGAKKRRFQHVDPTKGIRAILFTYDQHKAQQAEREALQFLTEFADLYYPQDSTAKKQKTESSSQINEGENVADDDIEESSEEEESFSSISDELQKELASLRKKDPKISKPKGKIDNKHNKKQIQGEDSKEPEEDDSRFYLIRDLNVSGVLLVYIHDPLLPDPSQFCAHFLKTIQKKEDQNDAESLIQPRTLIRCEPVDLSCFASLEEVSQIATNLIQKYLIGNHNATLDKLIATAKTRQEQQSSSLPLEIRYCVDVRKRGKNERLKTKDIQGTISHLLNETFKKSQEEHKELPTLHFIVDYKSPDLVFMVQACHRFSGCAVLLDYVPLMKYHFRDVLETALGLSKKQQPILVPTSAATSELSETAELVQPQ